MDIAFIKVLNMSISASWVVLAVILLRLLLKRSPKWIHVALWALVAVRLLCPFSIESVMSLIPSAETIPQTIVHAQMPAIDSGVEILDQAVNASMADSLTPLPGASVNPIQVHLFVQEILWCIGMAAMVAWALISYLRLKKKVAPSIDVGNGIYLCDYIDTPFILGIFKPGIYLPSSMEPDSASHVLAHERSHIARKDHWWKPLGYLLLTVHWFNPILWLAYILLCRDIELACDEKVIRDMGGHQKKAYSEALLRCSVSRRQIAACPLAFGEVGVKERVKTVLNYRKPAFWLVLVAVAALAVTAVCFLTDPVTKQNAFFGKTYQAEKILYRYPAQSYQMKEVEIPLLQITLDGEMKRKLDTGEWEKLGDLEKVELTKDTLARLLYAHELGMEEGVSLDQIWEENLETWFVRAPNPNNSGSVEFYLMLCQRNGEVYLGQGISFAPSVYPIRDTILDTSSYVNWLFRLNPTPYEDDTADTFGRYYRVNGQIYASTIPVGAKVLSMDWVYWLTEGNAVVEMIAMDEGGAIIARLSSVQLTETGFDAYFAENPALGESLRENNAQAWMYFAPDQVNADTFFYLLRQKDGTHYLACGGWDDAKGRESARMGSVYRIQAITSDDPYLEADSPFQWTLNLDTDHIETVEITALDADDGKKVTLSQVETYFFLQVLNSIHKDQIIDGALENTAKVQALVQCRDENGRNDKLDVTLTYDGEAVCIKLWNDAAWIIRNDWLNSFFFPYSATPKELDPFADPDNAYQLCRNIRVEYVNYAWVFENVQINPHSARAHVCEFSETQLQELVDILRSLPETAFEKADYPAQSNQGVDIVFRNLLWDEPAYPTANLTLLDGAVYYTFYVQWQNPYQTWKISDETLVSYIAEHLNVDKSNWDRFAPYVFTEGEVAFVSDGLQIAVPKVKGFVYDATEEGVRFRPEGQEGWVLVQYCDEPYAACGTGLQLLPGSTNYGAYQVNKGCYDGNEVWSFIDVKATSGDMVYNVVLLNEENARWVMDCDNEIWEIIGGLRFENGPPED